MTVGLGTLGIPPSDFWRMTPKEIDAAIRGRLRPQSTANAPTRAEFSQLMQLFPDG
jgi:uncharacterized phage protein (TIGR02216 family)